MDYSWFEMRDVRKLRLDAAVWIPLRASKFLKQSGTLGHLGYCEEFFGVGSIAVPLAQRSAAEVLGWSDVGIGHDHRSYVEGGNYVTADTYHSHRGELTGFALVLQQRGNGQDQQEWHLHQDLVIALELRREGDAWVAMNEGYTEVARLRRDSEGQPILVEVRAEYLKDYLRAREMALYVNSYRSRVLVVPSETEVDWKDAPPREKSRLDRWQGRAWDIHEGGWMAYGEEMAVFHSGRLDLDPVEDVPNLGPFGEGEFENDSWTVRQRGKRLTRVEGEYWRSEWIEPADKSPRVRGDDVPSSVLFIVDAAGSRNLSESLKDAGRWLWFRPEVMMALAHRRGGGLSWHTRDTGTVQCAPQHGVHFGVNDLGLVTVYAKDVALLPEWQQRIWASYNVSPDGGVSQELMASQVRAVPADTISPESRLPAAIAALVRISTEKFGFSLMQNHRSVAEILRVVHRFRAVDRSGLFALAKDVARVIVDDIDAAALQRLVPPPKGTKWGSLKSLENVAALQLGANKARETLSPIVGAYELRHADAHLPGSEVDEHLLLAKVDQSAPPVVQGFQLLDGVTDALDTIAAALAALRPDAIPKV